MLAVNAKIDGNTAEVTKIIKEYKLSTAELGKRLKGRKEKGLGKYAMTRKPGGGRPKGSGKGKRGPGRPKGSTKAAAGGGADDLVSMMDGRTKTVTLLKIAYKASELLDARSKAEVAKVEKAFKEAESLKEKYQDAMKLIGEEIPI